MPRASRAKTGKAIVNNHHDSEEEPEEPYPDSGEDDWQPEKKKEVVPEKPKRKATTTAKRAGKSRKVVEESEEPTEEEDEEGENAKDIAGQNAPDEHGNFILHCFKNDLTCGFRTDDKMCLWRRDGRSLLQKYMMITEESEGHDIIFKGSSVYSCWEEKRKNDFFQIGVTVVGDAKEGKVKVINVQEFETLALEDRPKVDITPKGAEGGEHYEEGSEEEFEEEEDE